MGSVVPRSGRGIPVCSRKARRATSGEGSGSPTSALQGAQGSPDTGRAAPGQSYEEIISDGSCFSYWEQGQPLLSWVLVGGFVPGAEVRPGSEGQTDAVGAGTGSTTTVPAMEGGTGQCLAGVTRGTPGALYVAPEVAGCMAW